MRILIFGATGMLGNTLYRSFAAAPSLETWGTIRNAALLRFFSPAERARLLTDIDANDHDAVSTVFERIRPNVVINAVGVIKQLAIAKDPLIILPLNAIFPHRLALMCGQASARLIHLSSDCVYSGRVGNYLESDVPDAEDMYGRSKLMGEVIDQPHVTTLRTSGIGHELNSRNGLLEWFLSQEMHVKGFSKAIYSGLPTVELARVIREFVLPHTSMRGLYHVSAKPIAKFDLLTLIAGTYGKKISIELDESVHIDRSLNSEQFTHSTGYAADDWPTLIARMHKHQT